VHEQFGQVAGHHSMFGRFRQMEQSGLHFMLELAETFKLTNALQMFQDATAEVTTMKAQRWWRSPDPSSLS